MGTAPDLVVTVPPATYTAGSAERGAWDLLLSQRGACGFGLLNQDVRLDKASVAHTTYMVQNTMDDPKRLGTVIDHNEDAALPYFTGIFPWDRAAAAGFPDSVSESLVSTYKLYWTIAPEPVISDEAQGQASIRKLLHSVYHLSGVMWAGRQGGMGSTNRSGPYSTEGWTQNLYALVALVSDEADASKQKLGTGTVASYPCAGLTEVWPDFAPATESPNPFPDVTSRSVIYGTPIYLKTDAASVLLVSSAEIKGNSDGVSIPVRTITQSTDLAKHLRANEFFMVPTTALAAASSYTVTVSGTVDGVAFVKTFAFKTR